MNVIAFDVSKNELVGVRTDKSAAIKEKIIFANTAEKIDQFLSSVKVSFPRLIVSSEATADYHRYLAKRCLELDIPFRLINPILTKQFTRATIRKMKTDLTDAHIIAKLTLQGEGTILTKDAFDPAKSLARTRLNSTVSSRSIRLFLRVWSGFSLTNRR